ncbi:MAG TPA: Uma2 family endonuclease [Chloroflexia bacterium]|nr:Uma2 family endonuclease [Chloroflexia bacterium]
MTVTTKPKTVPLTHHRFSVAEYERMAQVGILQEDDRLELIAGEIVEMSPIGSRHAACVNRIAMYLTRNVGDAAIVSTQNPIRLDDYSAPQPDVALLSYRDNFYAGAHPTAADVLLVVEVADTSLDYDRYVKLPLYAQAGVPEVWLLSLPTDTLTIYTAPEAGIYQQAREVKRGESFTATALPGVTLAVDSILL